MSEKYIAIASRFWHIKPSEVTPFVYILTKWLIFARAYGMPWTKAKLLQQWKR